MPEGVQPASVIRTTVRDFGEHECPTMAASLAYYTIFSLPPLLVIVISVAGLVWGQQAVRGRIEHEIGGVVGTGGVEQIETMMHAASKQKHGISATLIGIGVLLFGATGLVAQFQYALNKIRGVRPDPRGGGIVPFLKKRLLSFGLILGIAFLLMVSLVLTAVLTAATQRAASWLPAATSKGMLHGLDAGVSFIVAATLFSAMFKWLPDALIAWRDVLLGGVLTAVLFMVGKVLLGFYLGKQDPSAYGPAAALVLVLIWVYYSAMIVLFGAEFTQAWTTRTGHPVTPSPGAVVFSCAPLGLSRAK